MGKWSEWDLERAPTRKAGAPCAPYRGSIALTIRSLDSYDVGCLREFYRTGISNVLLPERLVRRAHPTVLRKCSSKI